MLTETMVKCATWNDMETVNSLYRDVRSFGKLSGSCDWPEDYPNDEIIADDIRNESLFIVSCAGEPIAVFSLVEHDDLDGEALNWNPLRSGVPVRIGIRSQYQGKGLGKVIMRELMKTAIQKGYQSLRLLASTSNIPANRLYRGLNFVPKGVVNLYQKEFCAYEFIL